MRAAPATRRRIPAALAVPLFLLLTVAAPANAGEATPQAIPGDDSAGSVPTMDTPRIVEFITVPPAHCNATGVVRGIVGIEHAGTEPVQVRVTLTAIERATGREIEVDEHILPAAGSVTFILEGDFSGGLTGFVAHVRLLDASRITLQTRLNPVHLPCEEPPPDTIVTLPVTGSGSGINQQIVVRVVALAATIILVGVEIACQASSSGFTWLLRRGWGKSRT